MACFTLSSLLAISVAIAMSLSAAVAAERRTYIIHMDVSEMPSPFSTPHSWYTTTLSSLSLPDGLEPEPTHLYTYNHVMTGFSAVLSLSQLHQLEKTPGYLATYPETFGHLHTTHTPKFLGLNEHSGLWPLGRFGDDIIIGIVDTGVWPESESFNDAAMPPVPERWGGGCQSGAEFNSSNCNKKLIGAKSFSQGIKQHGKNISKSNDYDSPRDFMGHGTHTSSTAAGSRVPSADYFGYATGSAVGMAPKARLAMYKTVFWNDSYQTAGSDTLAGMDEAISDGVDVMSLSLGFPETPFDQNPIAVGAFAAIQKGIFVACSAGNDGPHAYTIFNGAPWITTVGAGTIDRGLAARVTLGDGDATFTGKSVFPEDLFVSKVPLYYGNGNRGKEICSYNSLDANEVRGKFVYCDCDEQIYVASQFYEINTTGAAGAICCSSDGGQFLSPSDFEMPFVVVLPTDGILVKDYITNSTNSSAAVSMKFQITLLGTKPAPQVAFFSSRGPDRRSPWILKPDILAPGVDILAAWVPNRAFAPIGDDYLVTDYSLLSGTSMASPHVIGIAALLKSAHRDWSSAAIRSAMMTTAYLTDNSNGTIKDMTTGVGGTPLDFGGGHVNPNQALDPGLVYDLQVHDYVNYLCALNYTSQQILTITGGSSFTCESPNLDLNYPSFIVILNNTNTTSYTFKRVLTNVVDGTSVYRAKVSAPRSMQVVVQPEVLSFNGLHSTAEFNMTVKIDLNAEEGVGLRSDYIGNFGYLSWKEVTGKHVVTSPIVSAFAP